MRWEPVFKRSDGNYLSYGDGRDPLFKIIERLDFEKGVIEVGWKNIGDDAMTIYGDFFDKATNRFEFTMGFRVWNPWRTSSSVQDSYFLFDLVLESDTPYCADYLPVFEPTIKQSTL